MHPRNKIRSDRWGGDFRCSRPPPAGRYRCLEIRPGRIGIDRAGDPGHTPAASGGWPVDGPANLGTTLRDEVGRPDRSRAATTARTLPDRSGVKLTATQDTERHAWPYALGLPRDRRGLRRGRPAGDGRRPRGPGRGPPPARRRRRAGGRRDPRRRPAQLDRPGEGRGRRAAPPGLRVRREAGRGRRPDPGRRDLPREPRHPLPQAPPGRGQAPTPAEVPTPAPAPAEPAPLVEAPPRWRKRDPRASRSRPPPRRLSPRHRPRPRPRRKPRRRTRPGATPPSRPRITTGPGGSTPPWRARAACPPTAASIGPIAGRSTWPGGSTPGRRPRPSGPASTPRSTRSEALSPGDFWLGDYLRSTAAARLAASKKARPSKVVVRGSAPEGAAGPDRLQRHPRRLVPDAGGLARRRPRRPRPASAPADGRSGTRRTSGSSTPTPPSPRRSPRPPRPPAATRPGAGAARGRAPPGNPGARSTSTRPPRQYAAETGQPEDSPGFLDDGDERGPDHLPAASTSRADHPTLVSRRAPPTRSPT